MANKYELNDEELQQVIGGEEDPIAPDGGETIENTSGFKCSKCDTYFTTKTLRDIHQRKCKGK